MKKHTPGPWYVSPTGLSVWAGDRDEDTFRRICVKPEGKTSKGEEAEWEGNACLIATAPKLLGLAKEMLDFLTADFLDRRDYENMESNVRSAISKAEGKEEDEK